MDMEPCSNDSNYSNPFMQSLTGQPVVHQQDNAADCRYRNQRSRTERLQQFCKRANAIGVHSTLSN